MTAGGIGIRETNYSLFAGVDAGGDEEELPESDDEAVDELSAGLESDFAFSPSSEAFMGPDLFLPA